MPHAVEAQNLNHWTTREFLKAGILGNGGFFLNYGISDQVSKKWKVTFSNGLFLQSTKDVP